MTKTVWSGIAFCFLLLAAGTAWGKGKVNDYPTQARVEYVFACMSGVQSQYEYLQKCSCAVDTIAAHLTYDQFVDAQTIRSMAQSHNRHADVYQNLDIAKEPLDRFYRAEALAELKCF